MKALIHAVQEAEVRRIKRMKHGQRVAFNAAALDLWEMLAKDDPEAALRARLKDLEPQCP